MREWGERAAAEISGRAGFFTAHLVRGDDFAKKWVKTKTVAYWPRNCRSFWHPHKLDHFLDEHCFDTKSELNTGEKLAVGEFLMSTCGHYKAIMQGDGNFCVYRDGAFVFGTYQRAKYDLEDGANWQAVMQADGNFCVYKGSEFKFGSVQDAGYKPMQGQYQLVMQTDGNLCVYGLHPRAFKFGTVESAGYKHHTF